MYIFGYLRASTGDQNAKRAQSTLKKFVQDKGFRIAGWYIENESGASLQRPELLRLLDDAAKGDAIIIEQIDRLSRLDEKSWFTLKEMLHEKELKVISLDLPTSHIAFSPQITDEFTGSMIKAINSMMMDMLAAIARKDGDVDKMNAFLVTMENASVQVAAALERLIDEILQAKASARHKC